LLRSGVHAVLFVFRAITLLALAALVLPPFWARNNALDRLLPHLPGGYEQANVLIPNDAAASAFRDRVLVNLNILREEIHTDMCQRDTDDSCILGICPSRIANNKCKKK
jgi:hypothetical protein